MQAGGQTVGQRQRGDSIKRESERRKKVYRVSNRQVVLQEERHAIEREREK